ncbi:hypothetical protein [Limosilactobacillus fermentum]|uniref:hypothetical protein n=1 Tax=Limosilactobacillus fermentum TaxID=1613 RepID=UPI001C0075E7|nr:hypothetical protein [Limosilactobacillus fermentum]
MASHGEVIDPPLGQRPGVDAPHRFIVINSHRRVVPVQAGDDGNEQEERQGDFEPAGALGQGRAARDDDQKNAVQRRQRECDNQH